MSSARINKSTVDAAHPGEKDKLLWDDRVRGFGLKVTPSGSKVYVYQYRLGGRGAKVRRYTIGRHGNITPDGARREAERLALMTSQGLDPQQMKVSKARQSIDLAFKQYAGRFVQECLKVRWKSSYAGGEAHLRLYATPVLGNKPLPEIDRADIRAVLKPVRHKVATASYLFSVLRRLFRWAVSEGDLESSPLDGMEPPPLPAKRERFLSDPELALVWRASEKLGYPFGPLMRLLILTGARREEVAGLDWSELDQKAALWALPSERAKNSTAASCPLSDIAIAELDMLARRSRQDGKWPRGGLLFSTTGETSVSGYSRAKARLDREVASLSAELNETLPIEPWCLHDFRRTLATGMQRLGVRFEVTEAILNHVGSSRSGVAGIYQRHDWGPEKKAALSAWSDHLLATLTGSDQSNVVALASRRI